MSKVRIIITLVLLGFTIYFGIGVINSIGEIQVAQEEVRLAEKELAEAEKELDAAILEAENVIS